MSYPERRTETTPANFAQERNARFLELAAEIVSAYVSKNPVPLTELPALIGRVHAAVGGLANGISQADPEEIEKPSPAEIRKSVRPDDIVSFIDGKSYKTLKRHLSANGLDPRSYRERYGLPADYPMVAPDYAERRSALAKATSAWADPVLWPRVLRRAARPPDLRFLPPRTPPPDLITGWRGGCASHRGCRPPYSRGARPQHSPSGNLFKDVVLSQGRMMAGADGRRLNQKSASVLPHGPSQSFCAEKEEFHACLSSYCACGCWPQRLGPSGRSRARRSGRRHLVPVQHAHHSADEASPHAASLDVADPAALPRRKLCPKQDARRYCWQQQGQWGDR